MNLKRRHLTASQTAACVVEFEALLAGFATAAKAVQRAQGERGKEGGRGRKPLPPRGGKGSRHRTTASRVARLSGVSARQVERALALKKVSPEKLAEVKAGKKSLSQATREVKKELRDDDHVHRTLVHQGQQSRHALPVEGSSRFTRVDEDIHEIGP